MKDVVIYSADWCPYCTRAKRLLEGKKVAFKEINVDRDPTLREEIMKKTGMKTIPQIFIGDEFIGGFSELSALENNGQLDGKLNK